MRSIVQWGVSIAGVYERFDLSSLASGLSDRFKDYGYFSISPSLSFPSRTRHVAVTIESIVFEHFIGRLGGGSFSFSSNADYPGSRVNEFDNKSYRFGLHLEKNLSVNIFDLGAGYRFTSRYLNHSFLLAGLDFYQANVKVTSIFNDSLFNIQTSGTETLSGVVIIPYLSAGYSWPIVRFCEIGTELRYRYQRRPQNLEISSNDDVTIAGSNTLSNGNPPSLKCDFGGFDFRIFVNLNLKSGKAE